MVKPLRIGVIGVGYLGRIHARIYARMPEIELVAVVDTDTTVAHTIADELGCEAATEPSALIGRVDAVSVVVPTSLHEMVARPYLDAGIHVMLEKPIAVSVEQGRRIIDSATHGGVILQIGHLERFNSGFRVLAERVHSPRFIEVHRLGAFVERATDVDVVTDLMIHDID
ncbi:MAG TPA: Gfo/Idh/MocA family oxidoreductase, partial [Gammaproteobacteria bacterium]|nr:Gfo/Idh/MocA family oxidoreductase [Gammaproteobacteria bacterium]